MKLEKFNFQQMIGLGVLAIILFFIAKYVLNEISENVTEIRNPLSDPKIRNSFSNEYYTQIAIKRGKKPTVLLAGYGFTVNEIVNIADQIEDSKGLINDDEEILNNLFKFLPNIFVCSTVSFIFEYKYKKSLLSYLASFLNEAEMNNIYLILRKKNYE